MKGTETYRSWKGAATEQEIAEERRREYRRSWIRPASAGVVLAILVLDVAALVIASGVQNTIRIRSGYSCDTFYTTLAHDTFRGIWVLLAILGATLLATIWRRWVFLAVLVVQIAVAAVLVPNILHKQHQYELVAQGRLAPVLVDPGGAACC